MLVVVVCLLVFVEITLESCSSFQQTGYSTLANFVLCYRSFPEIEDKKDVVDKLKVIYESKSIWYDLTVFLGYVFKDYAPESSNPYVLNKNVEEELDLLRSTQYTFDFEVQEKLKEIFHGLKDRNTFYHPPSCYNFDLYLPFNIRFDVDKKFYVQNYLLTGDMAEVRDAYETVYPSLATLTTDYNDWEIREINGGDPIEYFKNMSRSLYYSKDYEVNFNYFIRNFAKKNIMDDLIPKEALTMKVFGNNATVDIVPKWLPHSNVDFTGNIKDVCEKKKTDSTETKTLISFQTLTGNPEIGVLKVKSFDAPSESDYVKSLKTVFGGMKNIKKLIVDVRNNEGGSQMLTIPLAKMISKYIPEFIPLGDLIKSDVTSSIFGCNQYLSLKYKYFGEDRAPLVLSPSFLKNKKRIVNGRDSFYSRAFYKSPQFFKQSVGYPKKIVSFEPENLIFLTDGTCSKECAIFLNIFKYLKLGRIVSQGGYEFSNLIPTISIASSKGSFSKYMKDVGSMQDTACALTCSCPDEKVKSFKHSNEFSLSWIETYPFDPPLSVYELSEINDQQPLEFLKNYADFHINNWNFENDDVYSDVTPFFQVCAPWEIKRNDSFCSKVPFKHAVMGHVCKGGSFDYSTCVLRGCDEGYYLNKDRDECKKLPKDLSIFTKFVFIVFIGVLGVLCCCGIVIAICITGFYEIRSKIRKVEEVLEQEKESLIEAKGKEEIDKHLEEIDKHLEETELKDVGEEKI